MRKCPTEAQEQTAVIEWAEWNKGKYPVLRWLHHIPNGGSRNILEAMNLKRQGVKAGVSDLSLPSKRGGYAGLYIEMKAIDGKPTAAQEEFIRDMKEGGYFATFCYGADEAIKTITNYLEKNYELQF